ncbi:MAG: Gfo/Idh/MocA family oxidoreductase [Planctomycetes bacterium]|nr:Gfo/Idh/MocA family oxidoreductase [Planctomycetota bacterium]
MLVTYNHEFTKRLRAGLIGCGGHAYRNICPVFQYAPIELVAVCDAVEDKARHFQRIFGAQRAYSSHLAMVEKEQLDVVFIVTNYDERGRARYPRLASDCLKAGIHTWIEKPPVNDLDDVALLRSAVHESRKKLAIGFKKMFFPANTRARKIIESPEFGAVRSLALRYPQHIPTVDELTYEGDDRKRWARRVSFLDHLCHPVSLMQYLGGPVETMFHSRAENGAGFAVFGLKSGATACIHFTCGQSQTSPLERTEVTGDGANVIVENSVRVIYHKRMKDNEFRRYGRSSDFTGETEDAPIVWEPEFSLGNLCNKGIFLLGYFDEIRYFCDAVLNDKPILVGSIDQAEEGIRIYQAFKEGPDKLVSIWRKD